MTPHQHARASRKRSRKTKQKEKTQQGDKPKLHSNGTQTGETVREKETENGHHCVGVNHSLNESGPGLG